MIEHRNNFYSFNVFIERRIRWYSSKTILHRIQERYEEWSRQEFASKLYSWFLFARSESIRHVEPTHCDTSSEGLCVFMFQGLNHKKN